MRLDQLDLDYEGQRFDMNKNIKMILVFLSILTIFVMIGLLMAAQVEPIHAQVENNCEVIGTVGSVKIARCTDPVTWEIIYANSAGFMLAGE